MALGFFRRRQKLVLVIMVLLMIAFLIQSAIRELFEPKPYKEPIGRAGDEEITLGMQWSADADIKILKNWLRMGFGRRPGESIFAVFWAINQRSQPQLAWALLLHEARKMGIRVTRQEVDSFLSASNLSGEQYRQMVARLSRERLAEKDLLRAVTNHLMVAKAFQAGWLGVPPSMPEVRTLFRDLRERIQLGIAVFEATDFADDVAEPTEAEIHKWFNEWKRYLPQHPTNRTPFGFGYLQPDRADVAWLLVTPERLKPAVKVPERLLRGYWMKHKGELTKEVPVPTTSTAPAGTQPTQPTTQPTQPAEPETQTVFIEKYSEAKPIIREMLSRQVAEDTAAKLLGQVKKLIADRAAAADPYQQAFEALSGGAKKLLARQVAAMPAEGAPLETIIDQLETAAGVTIVYPYGEHEKLTVDPKVEVALGKLKTGTTLEQVLEKIGARLKLPRPIAWRTCWGMEDAIFPTEPVNLLPIRVGRSGMVTFRELASHESLGWASTAFGGRGLSLTAVVATAEVFQGPEPTRAPLIEVGGDYGQAMYVMGLGSARLLWRLTAAKRQHEPGRITPAIRKQVVSDIKLHRGFYKADEAAKKMLAQVRAGEDLEKLAEARKLEFIKTDPFPRKRVYYPPTPPYVPRLELARVPPVGQNPTFIKQAFALAPADPNDRTSPGPAEVAPLERDRRLLLIQRIGYEPATEEEFKTTGLQMTIPLVMEDRRQLALITWFAFDSLCNRVGFVDLEGGR